MPRLPKSVKHPFIKTGTPFGTERYDPSFYQSQEWKRFRSWYMAKHPPLCVVCGRKAKYLDHIKPISQGGAKLDPNNVQWLCTFHNSAKTNRDRMRIAHHEDPYDDMAR